MNNRLLNGSVLSCFLFLFLSLHTGRCTKIKKINNKTDLANQDREARTKPKKTIIKKRDKIVIPLYIAFFSDPQDTRFHIDSDENLNIITKANEQAVQINLEDSAIDEDVDVEKK